MAKILILGAYGLLGSSLSPYLAQSGHLSLRQSRKPESQITIDPLEKEALYQLMNQEHFDVVINLIAATNVDRCEQDCSYAYLANVAILEALNDVNKTLHKDRAFHLIHISSDQVYDGVGPHSEDKVSPCNVYALSKLAGEIAARNVGATILRTNFVGKSNALDRSAFTDWIVKSLRAQSPITLFDDVIFSALHMSQLCAFIEKAVQLKVEGTFNVGCSAGISKAQFGLTLAERLNLDVSNVTIGRSIDVPLNAKRPLDMRLDVTKFESVFNVTSPTIVETIELVAQEYMNDKAGA